jgi:hypothetical protein
VETSARGKATGTVPSLLCRSCMQLISITHLAVNIDRCPVVQQQLSYCHMAPKGSIMQWCPSILQVHATMLKADHAGLTGAIDDLPNIIANLPMYCMSSADHFKSDGGFNLDIRQTAADIRMHARQVRHKPTIHIM